MKVKIAVLVFVALTSVFVSNSVLAQRPDGLIYSISVTTSFGTAFDDCVIFGDDGIMWVLGLGWPQAYDQKDLGGSEALWQSVTLSGFGFQIAFSGVATGVRAYEFIQGDAINEFGDTFRFRGYGDPACGIVAPDELGPVDPSPWRQ